MLLNSSILRLSDSTNSIHPQTFLTDWLQGCILASIDDNKIPESNVFGFDVPTWNFGFKISGDTTNKGRFYFGFVNVCLDGKTNPALKRTRLITNSEQFLIE